MQTVLLVEDDFYIRDTYRIAIEQAGYLVVEAVDGKEAIANFDQTKPDIVLLDIMLPEVNGIGVLQHIRAHKDKCCKTPVIILTNMDSEETTVEAMNNGATAFFVKLHTRPTEVAASIKNYFGNQ